MHVRVVRFTDATAERVEQLVTRIGESGPPPDVPIAGIQLLFDENQGTALALQFYDTAEDLEAGERVFAAMDAAETPGTRVSVDRCELKVERRT
jgi:hypothetical protein